MDKKKKFSNTESYSIDAKEKDYLYTDESSIPNSGNGLYTAIPLYKNDVISKFKGEILSDAEAKKRALKNENAYFINMPDGKIMDSMHIKCFAKYANDAKGLSKTKYKNNAKILLDENDKVCLIAKRDIKAGEEIFCNYGKQYWKAKSKQSL